MINKIGKVTRELAADISPHGKAYCPEKSVMPTGMVLECQVEVKVRANRNSFQQKMTHNKPALTNPEAPSGR